jgi:hypothetical protein
LLERVVTTLIVALLAPKLLALVLLITHWAFRRFYPWRSRAVVLTIDLAVFFAALLIPVDVYVPGFHGPLYGDRHGGPRLVRTVVGMPRMQECIERYGEFVSLGCSAMPFAPRWVVVWN